MITLEQVDQLRKRTNCSYEEAKALLEKHNGDVLEAIVDFEKSRHSRNDSTANGYWEQNEWKKHGRDFWQSFKELIRKGFENKVVIEEKNSVLLSMPVNIMLLFIIFIPYVTIPILLILLVMGFKITIRKNQGNEVNISSMVKDFTDKFTGKTEPQPQPHQTSPEQTPVATESKKDDYNEFTIE